MTLPLEVHPDRASAVRRVAELIAERLRAGASTIAFSRGAELLGHVAALEVPWSETSVYQVDERVAPPGHEDRNLTQLHASLPLAPVHPMPVDEADLEAGCDALCAATFRQRSVSSISASARTAIRHRSSPTTPCSTSATASSRSRSSTKATAG